MNKRIIIGKREVVWLITNMIVTKISLNFARLMAERAGSAGWILSIYLLILAIIGFFFVSKLFERFPGKDIIDIGSEIAGPTGRIIIGVFMLGTLLFLDLLYLREFSEHMKVVALNNSPLSFIMAFVAGTMVACFLGLESITRIHSIGIPILAISFVLTGAMTIPFWDFSNALPILGLGPKKIFLDGVLNVSSYMELIFIFFIPPFLVSTKVFKSAGYLSLLIAGTALTLFSLSFSLLIPYPSSTEIFLPIYEVTRIIEFGKFIQRFEALFIIFWSLGGFFFLSVSIYFTIYTFSKMFKLPYTRPLILPFLLIIYNLAFLPVSLTSTVYTLLPFFYSSSWVVTFILPIVLLIITIALKKGGKQCA
jgi:spore germination protein (amino acid permease)